MPELFPLGGYLTMFHVSASGRISKVAWGVFALILIYHVGKKSNFPSTLPGSYLRPTLLKQKINRRKTNSLITCTHSVYMGNTPENWSLTQTLGIS